MKQYRCKYFKIYELVDEATYKEWGQFAWQFLDSRMLMALDMLRDVFGRSITVNTWYWDRKKGKKIRFQWRGLRTPKCKQGASMSQHRFGRAVDFDVKGMKASEVRAYIMRNHPEFGIKCIEAKVNWVHMDVRNIKPLKIVYPA